MYNATKQYTANTYCVLKTQMQVCPGQKEKLCKHKPLGGVFPQLPNFRDCFYSSIETQITFYFFKKIM